MPKTMFCWRCQMDIPILTEEEWAMISPHLRISSVQPERPLQFQSALDLYEEITGVKETNPNAIWHHRVIMLALLAMPAGKPLRTQNARYYAACGEERLK
jgi:hypothetical protein